jgi:hypothetical protein
MRWAPTVCLLSLVGWSATASAQPLELRWQAPDACPDRAEVQSRVEHLLERGAATSDWLADARVARKGQRWILKLNLQHAGRRATRTLQADDCVTLSDAAAWLIAVAIDPSVSAPAAASVSVQAAATEPAVAPETAGPQVESSKTPTSPQLANSETPAATQAANRETPAADQAANREPAASKQPGQADKTGVTAIFGAGVFGGMLAAGFGGAAASLGAQMELRLGWLSFGLLVAHDFERSRSLPANVTAHVSSQELGLQVCLQWGASLHFGPCLALAMRRSSASTNASQGSDNAAFWATLGPCAQLTYDLLAQAEVFLNAGLFVPITKRPQFELEQRGRTVGAGGATKVGGAMRLGIGVHWQ